MPVGRAGPPVPFRKAARGASFSDGRSAPAPPAGVPVQEQVRLPAGRRSRRVSEVCGEGGGETMCLAEGWKVQALCYRGRGWGGEGGRGSRRGRSRRVHLPHSPREVPRRRHVLVCLRKPSKAALENSAAVGAEGQRLQRPQSPFDADRHRVPRRLCRQQALPNPGISAWDTRADKRTSARAHSLTRSLPHVHNGTDSLHPLSVRIIPPLCHTSAGT